MNAQTDLQTRIAASDASKAMERAKDGVLDVLNTLWSDFSEIEHYKDYDVYASALKRMEQALWGAFDTACRERDALLWTRKN